MKELDPPSATEVNGGGLNPRHFDDLPYTDPLPAQEPRIDTDFNPLPMPQ